MPGITGIIGKTPRKKNEQDLRLMVECMMHEPFYTSGTYINEGLGVYAGWICHEGSFSDCMPLWNEKKNIVMIFFGENFTDLELFDQLKAKHHEFDKSNASYIIHLYEEKGINFLQDMNGLFSGLLVDIQAGKLFLFNDRYGMQRIYYHEGSDAFYFSSEAKALLKICPELRVIDTRGFGEFLVCGCVLEYRTLFKNIFLLPGSSVWSFRQDGAVVKKSYFSPDIWENQPWLEKEFFYKKLRKVLLKVLPRYFRSNQKVGISLTGGLDTRIIMANMAMPEGKYPCYTFGGMFRDTYDVRVARKVAEVCRQPHEILHLDKQFLIDFPRYAEKTVYVTDGYLGVSQAYEVYLNGLARQIAPIRMTGNYGGELLRGLGGMMNASYPKENLFNPDFKNQFQDVADTIAGLYKTSSHPMSLYLFYENPLFWNHVFVSEQTQLTPRSPYLDTELVALMYRAPIGVRYDTKNCLRLISNGNSELGKIPTDRGVGGGLKFPLSDIGRLYKEFTFKAEYAYNYGMPQWLAKFDYRFKYMHFEKLFFGRHKFAHFRIWFRDELADYVKEILLDQKTLSRPYLNRKTVEEMVINHTKGYRNYTNEISQLLTIELIHRLLIDNNLR